MADEPMLEVKVRNTKALIQQAIRAKMIQNPSITTDGRLVLINRLHAVLLENIANHL